MSQTTTEIFPAPVIELSRLDDGPPIPLPSDPPEEQSEVDGYAGSNHSAAEDESQYPTGRKRAVMLAAYVVKPRPKLVCPSLTNHSESAWS